MTVLLMGDITGRSRVALRMLTAVLESCGHEVLMLPTALISNTLNLGMHEALDTTDYLLRTLKTWKALGIRYDLAYIGYITGIEQAKALRMVMDELHEQGVRIILDPILGDNGKKYLSVSQEQVEGMRLLCAGVDLITPNMTEASLLIARENEASFPEEDGMAALRALKEGNGSVLITSAVLSDGQDAVTGFDKTTGEVFSLPFERVPGHHWGTGDLFTGLLMDALLRGASLKNASAEAALRVAAQLRGEEKSMLPQQ